MTLHRLCVCVVILVAGLGLTAAGCSQNVFDAKTKNDFVDRANAFIKANNQLQQSADDPAAFAAKAQPQIAAMQQQLARMRSLVAKLHGKPKTIGTAAIQAADQVVRSSQDLVTALQANDQATVEQAAAANSKAIDSFNVQGDAWNKLPSS